MAQIHESHTKYMRVNRRYWGFFGGFLAYNFIIWSLAEFIFCSLGPFIPIVPTWACTIPWCHICHIAQLVLEILWSMCKSMVLYTPWASTQIVINNHDDQILIRYGILKISIEQLLSLSTCCWKDTFYRVG